MKDLNSRFKIIDGFMESVNKTHYLKDTSSKDSAKTMIKSYINYYFHDYSRLNVKTTTNSYINQFPIQENCLKRLN